MSNNTVSNEDKKGAKHIFDKISLSALKVEMVVMVGIICACVVKVTTTFIL